MKLALCTIQRNRGRWLKEWFAFHYSVGFRKFYFFAHKCTDDTENEILKLKKHFDIDAFILSGDLERPQLSAYQFAYQNFNHDFDWVAFVDGDEFLFPTAHQDLREVMENYTYKKMSGLAVYWACFGSSGHLAEPRGLVTENYRYRADFDFKPNRHIKSIIRGHQGENFSVLENAHFFKTIHGTFDASLRLIKDGFTNYEPNYQLISINHYATQSFEYFKEFKQKSGAADVNANYVRPDDWWSTYDRNEIFDESLNHIELKIKKQISFID